MSRPLRVEYPGALYHVTARGNERRPVFRDDVDRASYLDHLARYRERFAFRVHAYNKFRCQGCKPARSDGKIVRSNFLALRAAFSVELHVPRLTPLIAGGSLPGVAGLHA